MNKKFALVVVATTALVVMGYTQAFECLAPRRVALVQSKRSFSHKTVRWAVDEDDKDSSRLQDESRSLDDEMQGLGNYLVPYALAVIASLLVTGLFVKFVMLDS